METGMENMETDVRVQKINDNLALCVENTLQVAESFV